MKALLIIILVLGICVGWAAGQSDSYRGVTFSFKLTRPDSDQPCTVFHVGDEIIIQTALENQSNSPFPFLVTNDLHMFKYSLQEVGESLPIAYRDDRAHIISIRKEDPGVSKILMLDPIPPGETQKLDTMKLSDRYTDLGPGRYKLWIEYKTGEMIKVNATPRMLRLTSEVSFQILP